MMINRFANIKFSIVKRFKFGRFALKSRVRVTGIVREYDGHAFFALRLPFHSVTFVIDKERMQNSEILLLAFNEQLSNSDTKGWYLEGEAMELVCATVFAAWPQITKT